MNRQVTTGLITVTEVRAGQLRLNDLILTQGIFDVALLFTIQALKLVGDDVVITAHGGMEITTSQRNTMLVVGIEGAR